MLTLLSLSGFLSFSQEMNYKEADSITYANYINGEWEELIRTGKITLENGIDYYYLRMRLGIAEMERGKYIQALKHFRKALNFNDRSLDAWKYMIKAMVLSGRNDQLDALRKHMPENFNTTELRRNNRFLEKVYLESGTLTNGNFDKKSNMNIMGRERIYGEQLIYGSGIYSHAGARFILTKNLKLYTGYNFLETRMKKRFQYTTYSAVPDSIAYYPWGYSKYYDFIEETGEKVFDYDVRQNELYFNRRR